MTGALRSKYALGELIGEGRSGSVYRVHTDDPGPQLVIKVLSPLLSEDPDVLACARHLSSSLRSLRNPHLVAVTDLVSDPDMLAIVSEYVAGGTLAHYLQAQPQQPEATALSITQQVLAGLAVAHDRGFFHGHLTSQQVLLATSSAGQITAKVSGLATALIVRPAHLSDDPDASTDLHAAGVMLHEMLTGKQLASRTGRVRPRLRKPATVSPAVWDVMKGLLSLDEGERPTDASKELATVERVLNSLALDEPRPAAHSSTPYALTTGDGRAPILPVANLLAPDSLPADMLVPGYSAKAFDIKGKITPVRTPSITNLPVLPDPVDGWVGYVVPEPKRGPVRRLVRTRTFVALACLALGGIGAGLIVGLSGGGTKSFTYFSADTSAVPGLQTTRSWTLTGGKHPNVHVLLEFHTTARTSAQVEELIPTSLLAAGSNVTFHQPQPTHADGNHIVNYSLNTVGTQVIDASYDIAVPPKDFSMAALLGWSDEQRNEVGERYRAAHALTRISLPKAVNVTVSRTIALPLTGVQKDGVAAPSTAFGGAIYRIDNGRIATIGHDGKLKGLKVGRTFVHVTLGKFTVSSTVYVVPPAGKQSVATTPEQAPLAVTTSAAAQDLNSSDTSTNPDTGTTTNNGAAVGPASTPSTNAPATTPVRAPATTPATTPVKPPVVTPPKPTPPPATTPPKPPTTTPPSSTPPSNGGGGVLPSEIPPIIQPG
jgi:hypothetical protein